MKQGDRVRGVRNGHIYEGRAAEIIPAQYKPDRVRIEDDNGDTLAVLWADEVAVIE
jgi:hypothetical protein